MKKKVWFLAWLLSMAAAFGLYLQTVVTEAGRPPEPGWSRPLILDSLEGLSAYALRSNQGITTAVEAEGARIFYQHPEKGLLEADVNGSGMVTGTKPLDAGFKPADKLLAYQEGGEWFLAALQEKKLNRYRLDRNALALSGSEPTDGVRDFDRYAGRQLIMTDDAIALKTESGDAAIPGDYEQARWIPKDSPLVCLVLVHNGRKLLQFAEPSGSSIRILKEWTLPADVQTAVESLTPYADEHTVGALVELKDFKSGMVRVVDYRLAPISQERELTSGGGDFNPVVLGISKGELRLLLTQEQHKGDDDVVRNICRAVWDGDHLAPQGFVTRTDALSVPITGWSAGEWQYVLSADLSGDAKKLMLSGDSPELVAHASPLSREELSYLLPGAMMTLLPATMVGLFPAVYTLMPVLTLLFALSVFRLNWAEKHFRQLILFTVGGHIFMKGLFAYSRVLFNSTIPDISTQLPWYLNTPGAMTLTLILSTAVAWCIAQLRNPSPAPGDFWGPYVQFALIDLSIFILLVMPYYYAYVGLPVFFR